MFTSRCTKNLRVVCLIHSILWHQVTHCCQFFFFWNRPAIAEILPIPSAFYVRKITQQVPHAMVSAWNNRCLQVEVFQGILACLSSLAGSAVHEWKTACLKMGMGPQPIAFLISVSVNLWIGKMNVNQQFLGFPTIFRYKKAHRWSQPSSCSKGLFERPACFQHVLTDSSQEWLKESQQTWVYSVNSKIKYPTVVNYSTCSTFEKTLPLYTLFETQASGAAALCCFILCAKLHKAACCWSFPRLLSKSSRLPLKQLL